MPFAATWMNLEIIMQSEVSLQSIRVENQFHESPWVSAQMILVIGPTPDWKNQNFGRLLSKICILAIQTITLKIQNQNNK